MVGLQIAGNVFAFLTGFIACFLYFNIGMNTMYMEVFQEILHFPAITTSRGTWLWYALGPVYWALAFVVADAVPNLRFVVSFVFTFTISGRDPFFAFTHPSVLLLTSG